jgi:hypothetical protein
MAQFNTVHLAHLALNERIHVDCSAVPFLNWAASVQRLRSVLVNTAESGVCYRA